MLASDDLWPHQLARLSQKYHSPTYTCTVAEYSTGNGQKDMGPGPGNLRVGPDLHALWVGEWAWLANMLGHYNL